MTTSDPARCRECEREIVSCACCERGECKHPICHRDLILLVRQSLPTPHTHGG